MAKIDELERFDLSHLHSAVSAGEPLNEEVINVFKNILISKYVMDTAKRKIPF